MDSYGSSPKQDESKILESENPYLIGPSRLIDVMAAIQFLGTYRYYKVGFDYWHDRIKTEPRSACTWEEIFRQHPEFFRVNEDEKNVCLILRRARSKNFDVRSEEIVSPEERDGLPKHRFSRAPLSTSDVSTLVNAARQLLRGH